MSTTTVLLIDRELEQFEVFHTFVLPFHTDISRRVDVQTPSKRLEKRAAVEKIVYTRISSMQHADLDYSDYESVMACYRDLQVRFPTTTRNTEITLITVKL